MRTTNMGCCRTAAVADGPKMQITTMICSNLCTILSVQRTYVTYWSILLLMDVLLLQCVPVGCDTSLCWLPAFEPYLVKCVDDVLG
jgi:hypothetical protein